jgi:hypothetical protein
VAWYRTVRDPVAADFVRQRLVEGGDGPVFGTSAPRYNEYLASIRPAGAPKYTARDFRTHHATVTAGRRLAVNIGARDVGSMSLKARRALQKDAVGLAAARIGDAGDGEGAVYRPGGLGPARAAGVMGD